MNQSMDLAFIQQSNILNVESKETVLLHNKIWNYPES